MKFICILISINRKNYDIPVFKIMLIQVGNLFGLCKIKVKKIVE